MINTMTIYEVISRCQFLRSALDTLIKDIVVPSGKLFSLPLPFVPTVAEKNYPILSADTVVSTKIEL
jgi:hypothetical protein